MKVCKFGGSSVADASQIKKVKAILDSDKERTIVVVSAPGKRFSGDAEYIYQTGTVESVDFLQFRMGRTWRVAM